MVVRKQKKNKRQRGSTTHGWGAMKKHRGAGNRGGRGNAGTGKRADQTKPSIWKEDYFGKKGFKNKNGPKKLIPVNASYFEEHLVNLLKEKKVYEEKGFIVVDADKLGMKILGDGKVTKKFKFTATDITEKAKAKIKEAGGEVIVKDDFRKSGESKGAGSAKAGKPAEEQ